VGGIDNFMPACASRDLQANLYVGNQADKLIHQGLGFIQSRHVNRDKEFVFSG
jgi:hypothetical protein